MGRPLRSAEGGLIYHALNRANARLTIFADEGDYLAFERILAEAVARQQMRLLGYCLMPNHFHLLLWPRGDGDLSRFMRWLTLTHTQRWHAHRHSAGSGHLYQGRFKSFPVQGDAYFYTVCRYVERNALRAGLVAAGGTGSHLWVPLAARPPVFRVDRSELRRWPVTVWPTIGWGMPMSLVELLPTVRSLSRYDKLRLIQLLAVDLAQAEEPPPIPAGQSYPLWSPDRAFDAAAVLLRALDAERVRP